MGYNLWLKNGLVYLNRKLQEVDLIIHQGKIIQIVQHGTDSTEFDGRVEDCSGKYILPGSIDTHVHIREPGSEAREIFTTGTQAAAAGGVTTVFEHPISVPPPSSAQLLRRRMEIATPQLTVDVCFFGALGETSISRIEEMKSCGIVAFKSFLQEAMPGREHEFEGLTICNDYELLRAMREAARYGVPMAFHAENNDIIVKSIEALQKAGRTDPMAHYESRPVISETECIEKLLMMSRETGAKIIICHVSCPEGLELIREAKAKGISVIAETCPHYLFTSQEEAVQFGPMARCNPPIRPAVSCQAMWEFVLDGTVDIVGSDHGPYTLEEKLRGKDNIFLAPAGMPGLESRVPLMVDAMLHKKMTLEKLVELIAENPAQLFGIAHRKGFLNVGNDGDVIVVDPHEATLLDKHAMYTKGRDIADLFHGRTLQGKICLTAVRGRVVAENGVVDQAAVGYGEIIPAIWS